MRRDSSARRSSTMVAVSVAAVVIPMVVGMLLLPGAEGVVIRKVICGPNAGATAPCNFDVMAGTLIELNCTGTNNTKVPAALLETAAANIKVCQDTALRQDADTACVNEVILKDVPGMGTPTSQTATGWTAEFTDHGENTDVILGGSCISGDSPPNGLYFNFVLKATTSTQAPANNNSATSAVGLATASSVALLGLVMAAA